MFNVAVVAGVIITAEPIKPAAIGLRIKGDSTSPISTASKLIGVNNRPIGLGVGTVLLPTTVEFGKCIAAIF